MATRRIILKRRVSTSEKRLVVETESPDFTVPEEVFKYVRKPLNPLDNSGVRDVFVSVCTASELEDLPVDAPDDDSDDYFRTDSFDKTYVTAVLAESTYEDLVDAVQDLVEELKANDRLGAEDQDLVGDDLLVELRYHTVNAILKKSSNLIQHTVDQVLLKETTKWHGAEASVGTYDEYFLEHDAEAVLLGTTTKAHECRASLLKQSTLAHSADVVIGQRVKSHGVTAVLKASGLTKTHNAGAILLSRVTLAHGADVVTVNP